MSRELFSPIANMLPCSPKLLDVDDQWNGHDGGMVMTVECTTRTVQQHRKQEWPQNCLYYILCTLPLTLSGDRCLPCSSTKQALPFMSCIICLWLLPVLPCRLVSFYPSCHFLPLWLSVPPLLFPAVFSPHLSSLYSHMKNRVFTGLYADLWKTMIQ